jgi:molecular chaperone DnaK (HSP70)
MPDARFIVGIDLGTTHTVVAACPADGTEAPEVLSIPQLVTAREVVGRPLLPSVLYAPVEAEGTQDRWGEGPWVAGEFARRRGIEVPGRHVASAKSWLSHSGVDRLAPILPWGADQGSVPKISPLDASARLLEHVRRAWDDAHDAPLADQEVVLTVPASFDATARELTLEAATRARLHVRLLEEPQAAFYDALRRAVDGGLGALLQDAGGEGLVLVCDVGGGTTDLSLFRAQRTSADARSPWHVTRVAVGRHLLLGGDNMDLALAHACESRLGAGALDPGRFGQLVLACRAAKEKLLGESPPDDIGISVVAEGSRLVGGTLSTRLGRAEAESILLDGFFPRAPRDAPLQRARAALVGLGLPYERDVAITRHIAAFLARHAPGQAPGAVLLNGGVFHSPRIRERLAAALDAWGGPPVTILPHADPDLAVARGAVTYGLARRGHGVTIESGSARGYYVEVTTGGEARKGVCVVPHGSKEGIMQVAGARVLTLVVGRPVRFELFASDDARGHGPGDVVALDDEHFDRLPPVTASFGEVSHADETIRVVLEGELTAIGTLDLACVEVPPGASTPPRRFRLAFALRGNAPTKSAPPPSNAPRSTRGLEEARAAMDRVFGKGRADVSGRETKDLVRELERLLGERGTWTTPITRALFDAVWSGHRARRRSPDHERQFWQLAGYCLRPGFGDPLDPLRVASLAKLAQEKLAFPDQVRAWQQFWFAWRRIAAGLDESAQVALRDMVDPFLAPPEKKAKRPKGFKPEALDAMLEMASFLERVPGPRRGELGGWILELTWTDRDPRLWAALGRLGARIPAYASVDHVIPKATVERWLDHLLREKWDQIPTAAEAAARMARVTDDRARDVASSVRREVEKRLLAIGAPAHAVRAVIERVDVEQQERMAYFGEDVPVGLRLD